jgi:hypothetical protein
MTSSSCRRADRGALAAALAVALLAAVTTPAHAAPRCPTLIDHATWTRAPQGWRIIVTASTCGRAVAAARPQAAFAQAIGAAAPPPGRPRGWDPSPGSLLEQLRCHADFARDKPTWDLEAWRPQVPWLLEVLDLCNPA